MAEARHLPHAPITEAIIDFRAQTAPSLDVEVFGRLNASVGYTAPKEINLFEFGLHAATGKIPETHHLNHGRIGYRYVSEDEKFVAQFRKDGFTFSRLAPYTRWEEIFAEASRLYRVFWDVAKPEEVTRIGVRYVNRLLLPLSEVKDFSPFLSAPPPFPKGLAAALNGFLTVIQVKETDSDIGATVAQTIQPGAAEPEKVSVILDIDVFEVGNMEPDADRLLGRFEALREVKNRYFFASITEQTASLLV